MPSLNLFGQTLVVQAGDNRDLAVGPSARATVILDRAARRLKLTLSGSVCGVQIQLSWNGSYIGDANIRFSPDPTPATTIAASLLLDGIAQPLASPGLGIAADPSIGLEIVDGDATAFIWLQHSLFESLRFNWTYRE